MFIQLAKISKKMYPFCVFSYSKKILFPYIHLPCNITQPLTEMSTRNLPEAKERPVRKADNVAAICEPIL
jgi:hypothetical protein